MECIRVLWFYGEYFIKYICRIDKVSALQKLHTLPKKKVGVVLRLRALNRGCSRRPREARNIIARTAAALRFHSGEHQRGTAEIGCTPNRGGRVHLRVRGQFRAFRSGSHVHATRRRGGCPAFRTYCPDRLAPQVALLEHGDEHRFQTGFLLRHNPRAHRYRHTRAAHTFGHNVTLAI